MDAVASRRQPLSFPQHHWHHVVVGGGGGGERRPNSAGAARAVGDAALRLRLLPTGRCRAGISGATAVYPAMHCLQLRAWGWVGGGGVYSGRHLLRPPLSR
jgi:hypothetical protein